MKYLMVMLTILLVLISYRLDPRKPSVIEKLVTKAEVECLNSGGLVTGLVSLHRGHFECANGDSLVIQSKDL